MSDQRFIIEMGMGTTMHDLDYQSAASRAIEDAYSHVTLPMWDSTGIDPEEMRILVTVGVQDPAQLDKAALAARLPKGTVTVQAVFGGQNVTNPETGQTVVVATAAVEAFLPYQGDRWISKRE